MRCATLLVLASAVIPAAEDLYAPVKAVLDARCIECHGATKVKAGLRLDSPAAVIKGSKESPVVVAGKPDDSLMVKLILLPAESDEKMPPKGKRLSAEQIDAIKAWITAGAPVPKDGAEPAKPKDAEPAKPKVENPPYPPAPK